MKESVQIIESLNLILKKQEEILQAYSQKERTSVPSNDLLIAEQKATRASIELLRDEIEELHQVMKIIFSKIKDNSN